MRPMDQGAMLVGALLAGVACGMFPLIMGFVNRRPAAGISGFFTCVVLGFLCGILLAGPASAAFGFMIWYRGDSRENAAAGSSGLNDADYQRERRRMLAARRRAAEAPDPRYLDQPYTAIGHVLVCNGCRQSTTKGPDGVIPPECPTCGLRFVSRKESGAIKRPGPRTARLAEDDLVELRMAEQPARR